jgi:hypothetical protein
LVEDEEEEKSWGRGRGGGKKGKRGGEAVAFMSRDRSPGNQAEDLGPRGAPHGQMAQAHDFLGLADVGEVGHDVHLAGQVRSLLGPVRGRQGRVPTWVVDSPPEGSPPPAFLAPGRLDVVLHGPGGG